MNWAQPLAGAHKTTISAAEKAVGFTIPMPNITSAIRVGPPSAGHILLALGPVWVSGPEIALTFNSGEVTILMGRAADKNARQVFRADLAAIKVGRAAIDVVNGGPALVIQPRTDYLKSNPGWVEFYRQGLDINVISTRIGTKLLLAIAGSIKT